MELETGPNARPSGVARYVYHALETLLFKHPNIPKVIFHRPEIQIPEAWQGVPGATFLPTWTRTRSYELIGRDLEPMRHRLNAWLSLGGRVPRWPLAGPRLSTIHDLFWRSLPEAYTPEDRRIHEAKAAQIARYADLIITDSDAARQDVIAGYGRHPDSVFVAPLGLGNVGQRIVAPDPQVLARHGLNAPYLFALSSLEPRKNLPRLLDAFASIAAEWPDLLLAIGGAKGKRDDGAATRAASLGLGDRVRFLGYLPDEEIPTLFAGCAGFVHASLIEGFGLTVLEAMHYGAPVACANTGSLPEVGGDVPLYFDPLNVEEIAERMRLLLRLPDREERVAAGERRAATFTWEAQMEIVLTRIDTWRA